MRAHTELMEAMTEFDRGNPMRIQHFLKVWGFARMIGKMEKLDGKTQEVLEAAALVHDIGIRVCMEKYGRCPGKLQEQEGPAPAEKMLRDLGYGEDLIRRVTYLVGHHHTYTGVNGMDYQILLEADYLVNSYEGEKSRESIEAFCRNVFRTPSGIRLLKLQSGIA